MIGISIYYCGIRISFGELMHFNDMCVFFWLTGIVLILPKCIACAYEQLDGIICYFEF